MVSIIRTFSEHYPLDPNCSVGTLAGDHTAAA